MNNLTQRQINIIEYLQTEYVRYTSDGMLYNYGFDKSGNEVTEQITTSDIVSLIEADVPGVELFGAASRRNMYLAPLIKLTEEILTVSEVL